MARPREQRIDEAVLGVTLEVFFEHGVDGVHLADVARRAGVSRQSIYRRWPTARALVLAAVDAAPVPLAEPTARRVDDRLAELLGSVDAGEVAHRFARFTARLAADSERYPDVVRRCTERFAEPRRVQLATELRAAVRRGELRPDVDVDLLVDTLTGTLLFRNLVPRPEGGRAGRSTEVADLVRSILDGARPVSG